MVRRAMRGREHLAMSNDLEPAADGSRHHYIGDCLKLLKKQKHYWDLIILHPPCDALALSGNRWYGKDCRDHELRQEAIDWTCEVWDTAIKRADHVVLENPKSVIFQYLTEVSEVQYIQPHMFGHPEFKDTGLALHNLPPLIATNQLQNIPKRNTPEAKDWERVWRAAPGPERKKLRARTYLGVADAMADQWPRFIEAFRR